MGPNSKWPPKSKMAAWKLNNHIFGPNWHRSAIFWCKYGFLRARNSTTLLFFMSCGLNSKWPPKSKMAAWKLNNHISGPNWHRSALFWCKYGFLKSRNSIMLSFLCHMAQIQNGLHIDCITVRVCWQWTIHQPSGLVSAVVGDNIFCRSALNTVLRNQHGSAQLLLAGTADFRLQTVWWSSLHNLRWLPEN